MFSATDISRYNLYHYSIHNFFDLDNEKVQTGESLYKQPSMGSPVLVLQNIKMKQELRK
jgi:hypothetical protein